MWLHETWWKDVWANKEPIKCWNGSLGGYTNTVFVFC